MNRLSYISLLFFSLAMISWSKGGRAAPMSGKAAGLVDYLYAARMNLDKPMFTSHTARDYSPGEYLGVGTTTDSLGFVNTDAVGLFCNSTVSSGTGTANVIGTATKMRIAVNNLHNANWIDYNGHVWGGGQQCGNPYITGTNVYEENLDSAGNDRTFSMIANMWNNPDGEEGYTVGIENGTAPGTVWICGDTRNGARGNGTAGADLQKWVQVPLPTNIVARKVYGAFAIFLICDTTTGGGTVIGQRVYSWTNSGGRAATLGYGSPGFGAGASTIATYNVPTEITFTFGGVSGQHAHNIKCISGGLDCNYALFDSAIASREDSTRLYCWGTYGWRMAHTTSVGADQLNTPTDITSKVLTTAVKAISLEIDTVNTDNASSHVLIGNGSTLTRVLVGWGSSEEGTLGNGLQRNFATFTTPYNDGGQDEFNGNIVQFTAVIISASKTNWKTLTSTGFYGYYNQYQDQNGDWFFTGRYKTYIAPLGMHSGDFATGNLSSTMNCAWQYATLAKQYDAFANTAATTIGQGCSNACVGGPTTSTQCSAISVTCFAIHAGLSVTSAGGTVFMNATTTTYSGTRPQHAKFYIDNVLAGGIDDNFVNLTDTLTNVANGSHTGKVVVQGQYWEADSTTFSFTVTTQTDYYFSATGSGTACGSGSPCAPSYIATVTPALQPGNTVHLNKGDQFLVEMNLTQSGSGGNLISVVPYGSGPDPILGGMYTPTWSFVSPNLYSAPLPGPAPKLLTINGVLAPKARTPNSGYWTFLPASGSTTDLHFVSNPIGLHDSIAVKSSGFTYDYTICTAATGTDATVAPAMSYNNVGGNGAFRIGDTPDTANEWNLPSPGTLQAYNTSTPTGYAVPNVGIPLTISGNYITVTGVKIMGADTTLINLSGSHVNIQNDSLLYGMDWLWTAGATNDSITGNYIAHMGNGMRKGNTSINSSNFNNVYENNTIYDCGTIPGMGTPGNTFTTYTALIAGDSGNVTKFNFIDSTGYNGESIFGHQFKADSSIIHKTNLLLPDGGALYTWVGSSTTFRQREMIGNQIDSVGGPQTLQGTTLSALSSGIYLDNWTSDVSVLNNSVSHCQAFNLYDHGPRNTLTGNTTYQGGTGEIFFGETGSLVIAGSVVKHNNIGAQTGLPIWIFSVNNDLASFGAIDSNAYMTYRQLIGGWKTQSSVDAGTSRGIVSWQGNVSYDLHSTWQSGQLLYLTGGAAGTTYNLTPGLWVDANGTQYHGTITVPAYQSLLLIRLDLNSITVPRRRITLVP